MDDHEDVQTAALSIGLTRRDLLLRAGSLGIAGASLALLGPFGELWNAEAALAARDESPAFSGSLQLYSSTDTAQQVADAFGKKMGITVNNYNDDAGVVLARIEAEASNPRADVYLLSDAEGMAGMAGQGRLRPYMSSQRKTMTRLALRVSDPHGRFTAVGLSGAGPFIYNTKSVARGHVPLDWPDLLKPEFKDQLAMTDPAFSGPAYGAIFGILQRMGTKAGWAFINKLVAHGLQVYKTNTPTLAAVESGGRKIAIAQDSAAFYDRVAKGAPVAVRYPKSGTVLQGDVIGIESKSSNTAMARKFVDYVLSTTGQADQIGTAVSGQGVSGDAWIIPVQPHVKQDAKRVTKGIHWTVISLDKAAAQEAAIKAKFKSIAGG